MGCRYFVVLLTEHGRHIVTERLPDGTAAWAEDPGDVQERSSLAKIIDSADTRGMGVTVGTMRAHFTKEVKEALSGSNSKQYAHSVCSHASGRPKPVQAPP